MVKKNLYFFLVFIVLLTMAFSITTNANTNDSIKVTVNNNQLNSTAKLIDNTVYVPVRSLSDSLGASTNWDASTKTVSISSGDASVSSIVSKVGPSAVGIIGKIKKSSKDYDPANENLAFGTGVIYKTEGYIITNAHVVSDLDNITVVLSSGNAYPARIKAMDTDSDIALIKIDKGGLTPAVLGDISTVLVGDPVIAIGTPLSFSLRNSATKGIVSGINRTIEGTYRFIQSDAALNGGNSGGPLVNMKGEVIGINSIKYSGYGVEGLNFSIPIDTVKYVVSHFEKYGKVKRPFLGAKFAEGLAARYGLPSNEGLTITEVSKDSPAEKAGLLVEDTLTSINGVKVTTIIDYNEEMKNYLPGDTVEFTLERGKETLKLKVTYSEIN